ncbi:anion permease [Opitutia bacterium ISCC 51]|nr:anion permease [Opitutae bacterium ISCC 51]QXD27383.1 anion permease [Opitutae bacterium ISCC 52]
MTDATFLQKSTSPVKACMVALAAFLLVFFLPVSDSLSVEGHRLMALSIACLILWVTEAIPIPVTSILAIGGQALVGSATLRQAAGNFISPVFFFVLAMFLFAAVVRETKLDSRFAHWLLSKSGTDTRKILLAFMIGTAVVSSVMSDVPACALWMALGLGILQQENLQPGSSNFGKVLMLGITIAAFIGGIATPAGSSINIMGLVMLSDLGGGEVPFLKWMAIGIPMVVLLIPISWLVLLKFFPPEISNISENPEEREVSKEPLSTAQIKVMAIFGIVIFLWILSNWYPKALDVTMIALIGSVVFFLPGIGVSTWDKASKGIGWDILLMIGAVTSIGLASRDTGLATWVVSAIFDGAGGISVLWLIVAISTFTVLIHFVVPIGPVVNAVMIPPIVALSIAIGQPPMLLALPVIFTASCAFLIPLDAVALITYSKGYYRMTDMLWPGLVISVFWVIVLTALMLWVVPWLGLI